jgi:hypothetical protein
VDLVQFSRDLRAGVAAATITVSYRLWQRPQVKVGGRYSVSAGRPGRSVQIEVDSIELLPFHAITADDLWRSGERDRESLRARAAHAGPIDDDTLLYRIEFHLVDDGPSDR